ncbi:MAG: helix-turn-helix domain-containing protein [Phycisphaeraceae bacterium]|nr:helix-turn-helix domain-containing protein [Phycisphaeraceae bacterium]
MPNLGTVLKEEIARLARKEIRTQVGKTQKQVAEQRREIAELKRVNTELNRRLNFLEKREKQRLEQPVEPKVIIQKSDGTTEPETTARFSPKWLAKHREKLDLSAADYAKLVGCSPLSIYKWEKGESTPRVAQREALAAIRGIGKREALRRIELIS